MSIWRYDDNLMGAESKLGLRSSSCPFCETALRLLGEKTVNLVTDVHGQEVPVVAAVRVCQLCGWWSVRTDYAAMEKGAAHGPYLFSETRYAHGTLRNLTDKDIGSSLDLLRRLIVAKQRALNEVDPFQIEDLVGDVFSRLGYSVNPTSRSRDGGIDLYLMEKDREEDLIGVQVKRYKKRIVVAQVRSFLGALLLRGSTKGFFVGTSGFTSVATREAETARQRHLAVIELKDAQWLLDKLRLTQRPAYTDIDDPDTPFARLLEDSSNIPIESRSRD